jgi:hypothetical protein
MLSGLHFLVAVTGMAVLMAVVVVVVMMMVVVVLVAAPGAVVIVREAVIIAVAASVELIFVLVATVEVLPVDSPFSCRGLSLLALSHCATHVLFVTSRLHN